MVKKEKLVAPCSKYYEIFTDRPDPDIKYQFESPFELKNLIIQLAKKRAKQLKMDDILNVGRGNPNFFSTVPRYAFGLLTIICNAIGDAEFDIKNLGLMPHVKGISKKFFPRLNALKRGDCEEGKWLVKAIKVMQRICQAQGMKKDVFVQNLVTSTIGCFYPEPPRVQPFAEPVLTEFLSDCIFRPRKA